MKKILVLSLFLHLGCAPQTSDPPTEAEMAAATTTSATRPQVSVTPIEQQDFPIRLRTNGIIVARQQAIIKSPVGGEIKSLAEEGQYLKKGQRLVQIDDTELRLQRAELQQQLLEAALERDELMIRYAGQIGVDSSVSEQQMAVILAKSGYTKTERALDRIQFQIDQTLLSAPFSGRIADRKVSKYERIAPNTEICTLIDLNSLEVEFQLLEQEIFQLEIGQMVRVNPVGLDNITIDAQVSVLNPQVDENGLVRVRARLRNYEKYNLYPGMNALVSVEREVGRYLVIPKAAVVERSDRSVVFVYDTSTQSAKWKYVVVAHENDTHVAISEGLAPDDQIIYEGHMNLDHDAKVVVLADEEL